MAATFQPALAGGTYRVTSTVTTSDGRGIVVADSAGLLFYIADLVGVTGVADLKGKVVIDGKTLEV
jgi:hypothetical protein